MNIPITVSITENTAEPDLVALLARCDPNVIATRVAVPLARHWRDHLAKLPKNKQGYPSTGFWEDAARRVRGIATGGGNVLLYSDKLGLRKRLYGGPVKAVNVKNLTIPIAPEAYGTTTKDWPELGEGSVIVVLADGRKFWALWLGNSGDANRFEQNFSAFTNKYKSSEGTTKRARLYKAGSKFKQLRGEETSNPKFVVFKGSGGSSAKDLGNAKRALNLKLLFKLQPETNPQIPMPQVIPPDLSQFALAEVKKAVAKEGRR